MTKAAPDEYSFCIMFIVRLFQTELGADEVGHIHTFLNGEVRQISFYRRIKNQPKTIFGTDTLDNTFQFGIDRADEILLLFFDIFLRILVKSLNTLLQVLQFSFTTQTNGF